MHFHLKFQNHLCLQIVLQEFFRVAIDSMAKNSLRCVAIACRTQELNQVPKEQEDLDKWALPEDELILLAIVGIKVGILKSFGLFYVFTMWRFCSLPKFKPIVLLVTSFGNLLRNLGSLSSRCQRSSENLYQCWC